MTEVEFINKKLKQEFSTDLTGRPIYRVVWAPSETEKRFGTFREYHHGIIIREFSGLHERKKYSWIGERWVLEKLVTLPVDWIPESANGHYECIYTFQDKFGNYLPPIWSATEVLLNILLGKVNVGQEKETPGDIERAEEKRYQKDIEYFEDVISEHSSPIMSALHAREAIVVP